MKNYLDLTIVVGASETLLCFAKICELVSCCMKIISQPRTEIQINLLQQIQFEKLGSFHYEALVALQALTCFFNKYKHTLQISYVFLFDLYSLQHSLIYIWQIFDIYICRTIYSKTQWNMLQNQRMLKLQRYGI